MAITQTPLSPTSARKAANASAYNANSNSGNPISSQNAFTALTNEITRVLGPSSGLTSEDVDAAYLQVLMENYVSKDSEWEKYAFEDLSRGYTRNLVDEGNGKSNLLILVWTPGKGSPIHDHADAHCLMKVLRGSLVETRYTSPNEQAENDEKTSQPLQIIKESMYSKDQVAYMSDDLGLHRISNPSNDEVAVSLHLYTPPNAAKEGCNIFDARTGKKSHITQSNYYSVYGAKTGV